MAGAAASSGVVTLFARTGAVVGVHRGVPRGGVHRSVHRSSPLFSVFSGFSRVRLNIGGVGDVREEGEDPDER